MVYDCYGDRHKHPLPDILPDFVEEQKTVQKGDLITVCDRMLHLLDPDPEREALRETPNRMADALQFLTSGYDEDHRSILKTFEEGNSDEMVVQDGIPLYSLCEHHLLPFFGVAHIAYIPHGKIVGLSKLKRLVDVFALRLQVQERLTNQIAEALTFISPNVSVALRCRHLCMEARGIKTAGTATNTIALRGAFKDQAPARAEFLDFVKTANARITML